MTDDRNLREGIQVIGESARGLLGFVNGYRALSRVPVPQIHPFKFRPMLDYVLSPLLPGVEELGGRVDIALEDDDMVLFADEQLMRQVVANILKNALNALRDRFGEKAAPAAAPLDDVPLIRITAFVNASDNTEIHISNNGDPISLHHPRRRHRRRPRPLPPDHACPRRLHPPRPHRPRLHHICPHPLAPPVFGKRTFFRLNDYNIKRAYVLSNSRDVVTKDGVTYLPVYYVMFLTLETFC